MSEYPKRVTLESANLTKLLTEINDLVLEGREVSAEIDELEIKMGQIDQAIKEVEKSVDITDIDARAKDVVDQVNKIKAEQLALEKEIYARCIAKVPVEMKNQYEETRKLKEEKEHQRNKIGLRIQKFKDKSVPLARKLMKPYLEDQYDDYHGVVLENGELVGTIFNHLVDWKEKWAEKLREKYLK